MNNITFITPIHDITEEEFNIFYKRALTSLSNQLNKNFEYIIIYSSVLNEKMKEMLKQTASSMSNCKLIEKTEESDYCSMINAASAYVNTPFFSVLEFDDYVLTPKWIDLAQIYIDAYPEISVFLSIIKQVNEKDELIGITNELFWALDDLSSSSEEPSDFNNVGFLSLERALKKQKFDLCGSLIKTDDFILVGGLKKSIKIFFNQEFVLRSLYQGKGVFVIPKVGVSHTNFRPNSYLKLMENINVNEMNFYKSLSRKEYYFNEDRNIEFKEEN